MHNALRKEQHGRGETHVNVSACENRRSAAGRTVRMKEIKHLRRLQGLCFTWSRCFIPLSVDGFYLDFLKQRLGTGTVSTVPFPKSNSSHHPGVQQVPVVHVVGEGDVCAQTHTDGRAEGHGAGQRCSTGLLFQRHGENRLFSSVPASLSGLSTGTCLWF